MPLGNMPQVCKRDDPIRLNPVMIELAVSLVGHAELLFAKTYPRGCDLESSYLFTREEVWAIMKNHVAVVKGDYFQSILGAEVLPGLFKTIIWVILNWYNSDVYAQHQEELNDNQVELEQNILNENILEAERIEKVRLKGEQKRLKDVQNQASRFIRQEKAEQRKNKRKAKEELERKSTDLSQNTYPVRYSGP